MTKKLRIVIAQLNCMMGDIAGNLQKHIEAAVTARDDHQADIILFPESSLTGYPVDDLLNRKKFIEESERALHSLTQAIKGIYCVVGHPQKTEQGLFNACSMIYNGEILQTYTKQILPNYGVFDEKRYFLAGKTTCVVNVRGVPIGLVICEDLWFKGPAESAVEQGARLILSPNASPFETNKQERRASMLKERACSASVPIFYANFASSQDEIIFDGGSMAVDASGKICAHAGFFNETLFPVDIDIEDSKLSLQEQTFTLPDPDEMIYQSLVFGVKNYLAKNQFKGALIGVSGGIDSALTLAIAVDALGKENVTAVIMPSRFTSDMSMEDAKGIAERFGVQAEIISIEPIYTSFLTALAPVFKHAKPDITEENLQARARGTLLMALSNKTGKIVLTTGNRSEMAVGYCTLYGDMAGGLAVLKGVPKTLVYRLANYRNTIAPQIPERTIERPPTAELAFDQKDEDSLPPYSVLDVILEQYIDHEKSVDDIVAMGFERAIVAKVVKLVLRSEYKRRQSPVGIRISQKDFGRDRRYPIDTYFKE